MPQVPRPQHFQIDSHDDGDTLIVRLSGEFDLAEEQDFERTIDRLANGSCNIVVDLTKLTFIDSSGMRALLSVWNHARSDGYDLAIVPGTGQVRRAMELTGVDRVLPIAPEATPTSVAAPAQAGAG